MSTVKCVIDIEFPSEDIAREILRSVELDNKGYVQTEVRGRSIHVEADASSLNSMIHTLDDLLSCISVAGGIVRGKT